MDVCQCKLKYWYSLCCSDENILEYLISQCQTVDDMKKATKPFLGARFSYKFAYLLCQAKVLKGHRSVSSM